MDSLQQQQAKTSTKIMLTSTCTTYYNIEYYVQIISAPQKNCMQAAISLICDANIDGLKQMLYGKIMLIVKPI